MEVIWFLPRVWLFGFEGDYCIVLLVVVIPVTGAVREVTKTKLDLVSLRGTWKRNLESKSVVQVIRHSGGRRWNMCGFLIIVANPVVCGVAYVYPFLKGDITNLNNKKYSG